jgi:ribose transport system permease protein
MNNTTAKRFGEARSAIRWFVRERGNMVIFLFIWVAAALFVKNFATVNNNINLIKQAAIPIITCLGMTLVLMTGGIDLSVGFTVGLCSYMFGMFIMTMEFSLFIAFVLTLAVGAACGLINGILVQYVKIPAFIATLGTGYILFGIAQIISNGSSMTNLPKNVLNLGRGQIFGITKTVYFAVIIVILCYILMHKSTFGRALSALGNNAVASKLSGINTVRITVLVYVMCGTLAALSAILMTIRVNSATPVMGGTNYTFEAITAAILGGASLYGGVGTAWGSVLGVIIIYIVQNCINLMGVNFYIYQAVLSMIILAAIIFENLKNRALQ